MPVNRYTLGVGIIAVLILANIVNYFCTGWGLITVKVQDVPLRQVIKSIEWQGWVTIYTNIDPDTKISMWCDHVPLAEAMDTLAVNIVGGPGNGGPGGANNGTPPPGGQGGVAAETPPNAPGANRPDGGAGGRRGGGRGGAQWGLAFFVAPSQGAAKAEIHSFQEGGTDDNAKVFHYPTPLQLLAGDYDLPSADPRLQAWPGIKASPPPAPAPDPNAPSPSADNAAASDMATPAIDPTSLQAYLQALARGADIWIMTPSAWNPAVSSPPAPNSSIIGAVKNLVGRAHGSVIQGIVLRTGRGGGGGGGMRGFAGGDDTGWSEMTDRMRNAIGGLPEEARSEALNQLQQEDNFHKDVMAAPQEQRQQMLRQHMMDKMVDNNNWKKMTPEKRAQRYQRMVANRIAAKGH